MSFEKPSDYGKHEIDLLLQMGAQMLAIEVKSRDILLTPDKRLFYWSEYKGDFAEGRGVLIDEVNDWERKEHDILAIVVVSQITEERLFIPAVTKDAWKIKDLGYGPSYEVPVSVTISWADGVLWLKEMTASQ